MAATPAEAEKLAAKAVGDYLTACDIAEADPQLIGNYLMKLVSVTGVLMAQAEGSDIACDRLIGTGMFVRKNMPKQPAPLRPIQ